MKKPPALSRAVTLLGSQAALAKNLGISAPRLQYWMKRRRVPAEFALAIERLTHGAVSRHDLRPDIYDEAA